MTEPSAKIRWAVDLDRELSAKVDHFLPWGTKSEVLRRVIILLKDALEKDGPLVIGALLAGELEFRIKESSRESFRRSYEVGLGDVGRGVASESPPHQSRSEDLEAGGEEDDPGEERGHKDETS